jgi:hypothetical protein
MTFYFVVIGEQIAISLVIEAGCTIRLTVALVLVTTCCPTRKAFLTDCISLDYIAAQKIFCVLSPK